MPKRSFPEYTLIVSWLWIGILIICLVSCAQASSTSTIEVVDTDSINSSPSPSSTSTPIPVTATLLPPSPTYSPTIELPTETNLPTETPTFTPTAWPTSEAFFDGARVTFINNAGFLITVGDKKILIDALFEIHNQNIATPREVLQRMVNSDPPFDQIDLVIATHSHADHLSADLVRDHLRNNEIAVFVSSPDAVQRIERVGGDIAERLIPVDLEPGESLHLSVNGIELDCLYLTHGDASILNIGMVITVGGYTFFHTGDMSTDSMMGDYVSLVDLHGYGLPQKEIDLAFFTSYIFFVDEYVTLVEDGIRARYVSPMHYSYRYPPTGIEENFSNSIVFKDILESWIVPSQ